MICWNIFRITTVGMNGIIDISNEKDIVEAHRIYIYKNNTSILPSEIKDLIQHTVWFLMFHGLPQ